MINNLKELNIKENKSNNNNNKNKENTIIENYNVNKIISYINNFIIMDNVN